MNIPCINLYYFQRVYQIHKLKIHEYHNLSNVVLKHLSSQRDSIMRHFIKVFLTIFKFKRTYSKSFSKSNFRYGMLSLSIVVGNFFYFLSVFGAQDIKSASQDCFLKYFITYSVAHYLYAGNASDYWAFQIGILNLLMVYYFSIVMSTSIYFVGTLSHEKGKFINYSL